MAKALAFSQSSFEICFDHFYECNCLGKTATVVFISGDGIISSQMLEIRKLCNCPNLPHNIDPQAAAYHMRLCVANTRERKELVATLAALEGIDDAGLKEGKVDKAEKQRLEEKIERARHRLVELEVEYSKLTGGDNNKVEEPTRKQAEDHLFKAVWGRISGQIAVSGKLTDTLFEKETPVLSAATLPSAVGRGTKS